MSDTCTRVNANLFANFEKKRGHELKTQENNISMVEICENVESTAMRHA